MGWFMMSNAVNLCNLFFTNCSIHTVQHNVAVLSQLRDLQADWKELKVNET